MRIVLLTGMSGSGKSNGLRALEDAGFYAIDNLPIGLLPKLVELLSASSHEVQKLALVVDVRTAAAGGEEPAVNLAPNVLRDMANLGHEVDLVFLDASDDALARRFSETRRRHPLAPDGSVAEGISAERRLLEPLSHAATTTIDTTRMSVHDLKREIQRAFLGSGVTNPLSLDVVSFGYKYGLPAQANLVFDVRFLPNPYFVEELRARSGREEAVAHYVLDREDTQAFLEHVRGLLEFLLPRYQEEGKAYLTLAFGCTGGRHRSVAIVEEVARWLSSNGRRVSIRHRDVDR